MRFKVRDENGNEYNVEELKQVEKIDEDLDVKEVTEDESGLSSAEIDALKSLAAVADKLVALVATTDEDKDEDDIEDEDEQIEEVIDTDGEKRVDDSIKKAASSIEKRRKVKTDDSLEEDAVAAAWANRYNGGNK